MPNIYYFLLMFLVLVLAVIAVLRHKIYYHFKVVEPGKLYRSGRLSPVGLHLICRKYRIKTIVSLVSKKEISEQNCYQVEERFCRHNKINLINILLEQDRPPEPEQVHRFLQISMNSDFQPILVHCEAGIIRTNMMIATYLKNRFYKPNLEILENLPLFGHSIDERPVVKDFIIGYQKESWDIASGQDNKTIKPGKIKTGKIIGNPMISKNDFETSSPIMFGKNDDQI